MTTSTTKFSRNFWTGTRQPELSRSGAVIRDKLLNSLALGFLSSEHLFVHTSDRTPDRIAQPRIAALEHCFAQLLDNEPELSVYINGLSKFPLGGAYTAGSQCFFVARGILPELFLVRSEGLLWKREVVIKLHGLSRAVRSSGLATL